MAASSLKSNRDVHATKAEKVLKLINERREGAEAIGRKEFEICFAKEK